MSTRYRIHMSMPGGATALFPVPEGRRVLKAEYPTLHLFLHQKRVRYPLRKDGRLWKDIWWHVSEFTTGYQLTVGATPDDAIEAAKAALLKELPKIKRLVAAVLKDRGSKP